jgi:hypothetical protein
VRPGAGEAHDLVIESGYVRCHAIHGSIHQDAMQAGGGERITLRGIAFDCLGNSNFYASGWNGSRADGIVCEGCAFGPNSGSTLYTNSRSERSGARRSLVCVGRFERLTFRLESGTSVNQGNQRAERGDPRCRWQGLLSSVSYQPVGGNQGAQTPGVQASLVSARPIETAGGGRAVRVELELGEAVRVHLRLVRAGRTLTSRRMSLSPGGGTRVVRLAVPPSVAPGAARLLVAATDASGEGRTFRRRINLPRP